MDTQVCELSQSGWVTQQAHGTPRQQPGSCPPALDPGGDPSILLAWEPSGRRLLWPGRALSFLSLSLTPGPPASAFAPSLQHSNQTSRRPVTTDVLPGLPQPGLLIATWAWGPVSAGLGRFSSRHFPFLFSRPTFCLDLARTVSLRPVSRGALNWGGAQFAGRRGAEPGLTCSLIPSLALGCLLCIHERRAGRWLSVTRVCPAPVV